ncbi:ChaN family lipoprotein [Candidatus Synechococcus calcipolaris G9]|uniref:ChaN family lipoprotein n=1 Tax=Candidatus Synechococcus calcipolaris G9 TaxID=1497997 RepID=A0ABT6EWA6_9SYNE|nr:ChaN family lipoprotein [Candidatus Synechococcus calcipolaris]MDG2990072.1 ChaN family lipoprotein [Candidatus Synechococcus calcipolaris G9]
MDVLRSLQIFANLTSPKGLGENYSPKLMYRLFWGFILGLVIFSLINIPVVQSQQVFDARTAPPVMMEKTLQELSHSTVIYLGETHDRVADHQAQLTIIDQLYQKRPLAIALEMIQRPFQAVLDGYIAGELTELELQEQTEYAQRWGFSWQLYAPIFRFAKENGVPLIALNTPTEVTRKVAREGLNSLSREEQTYIPPLDEIDLSNEAYRQQLAQIFREAHQGQSHSLDLDKFFQAQVLWDETMAAAIANYVEAHPEHLVVVLAGQGHVRYGYGIPDRVARRLEDAPSFQQQIILLNPSEGDRQTPGIADWFWINS